MNLFTTKPGLRSFAHSCYNDAGGKMNLEKLAPFSQGNSVLNVILETPKGSRNKYSYDNEKELFRLKKVLPVGAVFPFDFGFIPGTVGEDGDPLDVLLFMDEPVFPGCLVEAVL